MPKRSVLSAFCALIIAVAVFARAQDSAPPGESASADSPDQQQTVVVVAAGIGRDDAGATKDALSNAVRQAIGEFVSAETLVKNDDVVRDQILTYSDGFVEDYDLIGKPQQTDGGLISITIRANVKRSKLLEKVKASNISIADFNGKALFSEVVTQQERKQSALELAKAKFSNVQFPLFLATAGTPRFDENQDCVVVPVTLGVDRIKYIKLEKDISAVLDQICTESQSCVTHNDLDPRRGGCTTLSGRVRFKSGNYPNAVFFVCEMMSNDLQSGRWRAYVLTPEVFEVILNQIDEQDYVSVELLDASGNVVDSRDVPLSHTIIVGGRTGHWGGNINWLRMAPIFGVSPNSTGWESPGGKSSWTFNVSFKVSLDQLRTITKSQCSVNDGDKSTVPEQDEGR